MAEVIAVLGIVSQIATFVNTGIKVLNEILQFREAVKKIPKVVLDVEQRLPLVIENVKRIKERCSDVERALSGTVQDCVKQIEELDKIIEKMRAASLGQRVYEAITANQEKRIVEILQTLESHQQALTLHFSVPCGSSMVTESTIYEIPSRPVKEFVERKELLEEIKAKFAHTAAGGCPKVVVLVGMGGSGKTQLALSYCGEGKTSGKFKLIFWIDSSSPMTVSRGFENLAARLSSAGRVFDDVESKIYFVKETLGKWRSPWLLIFDNYDQPSEFDDVTRYIPQGETGAILFTSRHVDSRRLGDTINVSQMTEDESLLLLLRQSGMERTDDNVKEGRKVVQMLGNLPLAVDQAGAYIFARGIPLHEFAKHYEDRKKVIWKETPSIWEYRRKLSESEEETVLSVFTTWELSFKQISSNDDERARIGNFLTLCAFLGASNIFEGLFRAHMNSLDNSSVRMRGMIFDEVWDEYKHLIFTATFLKSMECFISQGEWDHYKYGDTVKKLRNLSLLQSEEMEGPDIVFSLHPLVQEWLRLREDQKSCEDYIMEAMQIVAHSTMMLEHEKPRLYVEFDILSHIDMCLVNNRDYLQNVDDDRKGCLSSCLLAFGRTYFLRCQYARGETTSRQALQGYERMFGPNHTLTLSAAYSLGEILEDGGKYEEAREMYERVMRNTKSNDVRVIGKVKNRQANLYLIEGKFEAAEELNKQTLVDFGSTNEWVRFLATDNLGRSYLAQNKLEEAEEMLKQAWRGWEKTNDRHLYITMHNLGLVYGKQGKLEEAEKLHKRVFAWDEENLGLEHPDTLQTMNALGGVYYGQNRFKKAEEILKQAHAGLEKVLGNNHHDTLVVINNLGYVYYEQKRFEEAEEMYKQAHAGYEKLFGVDHLKTLVLVNNLGNVYYDQNRFDEAKEMYKQVHSMFEKVLGGDHPDILTVVNNLGNVYYMQNRFEEAEEMFKQAHAGYEKIFGADHGKTLAVVKNLHLLNSKRENMDNIERRKGGVVGFG